MGTIKQIFTTYSTVTTQSAEMGDTSDNGWYDSGFRYKPDDKPETGFLCDPDEVDSEDGITAVDIAVKYLKDNGVCEASSSHFHTGIWYSAESQREDYSTDESIEYSFHLEGFNETEQELIFSKLFKKQERSNLWSTKSIDYL